uniref:Uncharacterized protein n=1 Tax=Anguilla anguilla TaxID=7936 RepID=A0A0E9W8N3_ANGAN
MVTIIIIISFPYLSPMMLRVMNSRSSFTTDGFVKPQNGWS